MAQPPVMGPLEVPEDLDGHVANWRPYMYSGEVREIPLSSANQQDFMNHAMSTHHSRQSLCQPQL